MPKLSTPLNDTQVKALKPKDKSYKLTDGQGLYIFVSPTGIKSWRIDYSHPITKKRLTYTIGTYPEFSLKQARDERQKVKDLLQRHIDPNEHKKEQIEKRLLEQENTFESVATEWLNKQSFSANTIKGYNMVFRHLFPIIGHRPINKLRPIEVLQVCQIKEKEGKYTFAKKERLAISKVLQYAVATTRAERDVTQDITGALQTGKRTHNPAITDPLEFGRFLRAVDAMQATIRPKIALQLMPLLFVRPMELMYMRWSEIDRVSQEWRYTASKTGIEMIVPLASQSLALLEQIQPITGNKEFVFHGDQNKGNPIDSTIAGRLLKRINYKGIQTMHGFRATARTMLEEQLDYDYRLIEMQLGHTVRDTNGRAYNRVTWLDKRKEMMQRWADYLDELRQE